MTTVDPTQAMLDLGDLSDIPVAANDDVAPVRDRTVPARRPPARNIGHLPKRLPRYDEVIEPESNRAKAKIGMANITYNMLRYAFHECRRATA